MLRMWGWFPIVVRFGNLTLADFHSQTTSGRSGCTTSCAQLWVPCGTMMRTTGFRRCVPIRARVFPVKVRPALLLREEHNASPTNTRICPSVCTPPGDYLAARRDAEANPSCARVRHECAPASEGNGRRQCQWDHRCSDFNSNVRRWAG